MTAKPEQFFLRSAAQRAREHPQKMAADSDVVVGFCVFAVIGLSIFFIGYQAGKWMIDSKIESDATQRENPTEPTSTTLPGSELDTKKNDPQDEGTANLHKLYKKGHDEPRDQATAVKGKENEKWEDKMRDAVVHTVMTRLVEKLEGGEIRIQPCPACDAGGQGADVKHVTKVTYQTRLQYQCLVGDKVRWGLLEKELRKAFAKEMDLKMESLQHETRNAVETLNRTIESQVRELISVITKELKEMVLMSKEEYQRQMAEMNSRLQEMDGRLKETDSRLALEPQIMEIRGFMKIDTFGPALLAMGAMQVLLLLCAGFLFMRIR